MAKKIGYTNCKHCGNKEASVKETDTGTLSVNCHHCDISSFAKAGTKAARLIRAALTPCDDEGTQGATLETPPKSAAPKKAATAPPAAAPAQPAAAPAPRGAMSAFNPSRLGA